MDIVPFAIIGSGVSGGRIAADLANAGAQCLLVEAGSSYPKNAYPQSELLYSSELFWGGGIELTQDAKLGLLRARCLGGTSVVNQALLDRFDSQIINEWRELTGISTFNLNQMNQVYDQLLEELEWEEISSEHQNRNAKIFTEAMVKMHLDWSPLVRGQKNCQSPEPQDCIRCLGGCSKGNKQSSTVALIEPAQKKGLEIRSNFDVHHLELNHPDYVRIIGINQSEIRAQRVVLAAGSIGTTSILYRSKLGKTHPGLGKRFTCHPQYMTYGFFKEPVDAHRGAFQSVKSKDRSLRKAGFKLENVFSPPAATAVLLPGFGRAHHRLMEKYRYLASIEVCIQDSALGEISYHASQDQITIKKPFNDRDTSRVRAGTRLIEDLFRTTNAQGVVSCKQGFGLHLMGGATLGTDGKTAVINPDFQLFEDPRVYCADSSVFPSAPGINPSLTIMALSRLASQKILAEAR